MAHGPNLAERVRFPIRIIDNYGYFFESEVAGVVYLKCRDHDTKQCRGRAKLEGNVFTLTQTHQHAPDAFQDLNENFVNILYRTVTTQLRDLTEIYDSLSTLYEDAANRVNYENLRMSMRRWRKGMLLPTVSSFSEYKNIVESIQWQTLLQCKEGNLQVHVGNSGQSDETLIFVVPTVARAVSGATLLYIGTTGVVPQNLNATEVLSISAIHGNHSFTFLWACMSNKSLAAYKSIVTVLKSLIPEPQQIFHNFEIRLHTELETAYPDAKVKGTFLDYCNIILQKAMQLGLSLTSNNLIFLKKLISLGKLPSTDISAKYIMFRRSMTPAMLQIFAPVVEYFQNTWLTGVGTSRMSFFQDLQALYDCQRSCRNNFVKFVGLEPTIWQITMYIVQNSAQSMEDINKLQRGERVRQTPLARTVINSADIQRFWGMYINNDLKYSDMLARCSFILRKLIDNVAFSNLQLGDDFQLIFGENNFEYELPANNERYEIITEEQFFMEINPNFKRARRRLPASRAQVSQTNDTD